MSTTNNITDFDTSDKMNKIRHDVFTLHREMYREIDKLKEKNRVLQEDNEELNEQLNDRVMIEDIAHAACRDEEGNDFDWESEIGGLVIDNKKLREEIERDSGCEENAKLRKENEKLKEHLECEEDGYPTSDWFKEKLDFHIKYHFTNEGGEYYENLKDLKEKPNCLDDLIYGSLERLQEEFKEKEETFKYQSDMEKQCHNDDIDKKQQVIDELKDENEELKEENNKLKEEVEEVKSCLEYDEEEAEIVSKDYLKKLEDDNKSLKAGYTKQTKRRNWDAAERKKLREEIEKLHKTINTMACSAAATDFCMEHWIIHEQIDPKLLLGNWEEFYEKDENGKWIKKPKTD
jgi:cell division protein FtsB